MEQVEQTNQIKQMKRIWKQVLKVLEQEVSTVGFETWILPIVPYCIEGENFLLQVNDFFYKDTIDERYLNLISNTIKNVTKHNYNVQIVSAEETHTPTDFIQEESEDSETLCQEANDVSNLNPRYIFSSFVVGNSNRMAHAASIAVAKAPAKAYNPLFLYGSSGLGKTHLMHSIAHYILEQKPSTKVLYVTSETFTNELINSIQNNKNEEFRNKYRNIDILLVDDIQFISKKEGTQEEFFHTFNALYESNKQIIISSDRPPKEIKTLEERLRSRFEWGLIADIQEPDYETRIAILKKKADTEGIVVSDKVLEFIAKSIVSNIRELEGALTRTIAYAMLAEGIVTIEMAQNALKDVFGGNTETPITPLLIQEVVAHHYEIQVSDLQGSKKTKGIAFPRQIAMYLCRKILDISLPKIGEQFGGRDHTTVIHAITKIEKEIEKNNVLQDTIFALEKQIRYH